jgi:hypothetical protein
MILPFRKGTRRYDTEPLDFFVNLSGSKLTRRDLKILHDLMHPKLSRREKRAIRKLVAHLDEIDLMAMPVRPQRLPTLVLTEAIYQIIEQDEERLWKYGK